MWGVFGTHPELRAPAVTQTPRNKASSGSLISETAVGTRPESEGEQPSGHAQRRHTPVAAEDALCQSCHGHDMVHV